MSIERPLSRRAFFKAAGVSSAAFAASACVSPGRDEEVVADVLSVDQEFDYYVTALKQKAADDGCANVDDFIKLSRDMWRHFRMGTQHVALHKRDHVIEAYDFTTGKAFVKNLNEGNFGPGSALEFNTRYCCYLCGYYSLCVARARPDYAGKITLADYEKGWKDAEGHMFKMFDHAPGINRDCDPVEKRGGGC